MNSTELKGVNIKKKVIKKSKKRDVGIYRELSSLLFDINEDLVNAFISKQTKNELNNHVYRMMNQLSIYVPFIKYADKYLNNLMDKHDFKNMAYTLNALVKMMPFRGTNDLKYGRYKPQERDKIYSTLQKYYALVGDDLNSGELRCLCLLQQSGIITEQHLEDMRVVLSDKSVRTTTPKKNKVSATVNTAPKVQDNTEIIKFKTSMLNFIKNRVACGPCPLNRNGFLLISTNAKDLGPVDISFIGDGGSEDEIVSQSHGFESVSYLIELCNKYKLTYAFFNLTMCNIGRANTAAKAKQAINACSSIHNELEKAFPSILKVLVGDNVRTNYGIKGGRCAKLNGKSYGNKIVTVDYDKLDGKALSTFLIALEGMITQTKFTRDAQTSIESNPDESNYSEKLVRTITPDMLLFDVKNIGDKVLYIFTNKNNEKVYYIEEFQSKMYLKSGDMGSCDFIEDVDGHDYVIMSSKEQKMLKRTLYTL